MPSQQALIVPQAQARVLNERGLFVTIWYRFFQDLAQEIPQIGDAFVQAAGQVTQDYLVCDGAAVSRTGRTAALFAVIGTDYGIGDGFSTFNLPNWAAPSAPGFWKIRYQ